MKPNIHPDNYRTVLFFDSSANEGWLIRSCAETHGKTMVWTDGKEYPLFSLDTSSASHPVYTGKQRNVNTEGRASKFNQRFQSVSHRLERTNNAGSVFTQNRQTTPPRLPNRQAQGQSLRHLQKQSAF